MRYFTKWPDNKKILIWYKGSPIFISTFPYIPYPSLQLRWDLVRLRHLPGGLELVHRLCRLYKGWFVSRWCDADFLFWKLISKPSPIPPGHPLEAVPHPALHPPHHGVGKQSHPEDHITNPPWFQVLFGMFVIAIACDQFEAIFSDETLVSCCETTVLPSLTLGAAMQCLSHSCDNLVNSSSYSS